ncbi:MAG: efflux RND transporter periplasmic adaptor subunit [Deltaproteobacteria bacterium]|nr:efflux RND transporter periplasmic adaptor subunit [Deltaproteobacteria bacterium]MBW2071302.1 efflux RND transporter periplasmic adaptor subunit [Deltaproteobacteria bacterium]
MSGPSSSKLLHIPLYRCLFVAWTLVLLGSMAVLAQQRPPAAPVKVARVTSVKMRPQVTLIGNAEPSVTSVVAAEVEGLVKQFSAEEGTFLQKGDVIARLEATLLLKDLQAARANRTEVEARLNNARAELRRSAKLLATKAIADKKYTDDLAEVETLEARMMRMQAEIGRLQDEIAKKTIEAPFSGFVVEEHAQVGEWLSKGGPVITLADLKNIEVLVDVPERYISRVRVGDPVRVTVDALNPGTFQGKVIAVIPVGDTAARTFPVKVAVHNPDARIMGAMLCRVSLPLGEEQAVLAVPKDAVVNRGARYLLFTVENGKARPIPVGLGRAANSMIEVKGPVKEGMVVVVRGNERLRPGQPVQVIP